MQYDPFRQYNRSIPYIDPSYWQDAGTIEQLRRERQPQQILILTVISPELHFDAAVGLCIEGSISEVNDATT